MVVTGLAVTFLALTFVTKKRHIASVATTAATGIDRSFDVDLDE